MKHHIFLVLAIFIFQSYGQSFPGNQLFKSIHQMEYEAHRHIPKQPSFFDSSGQGIIRLAKIKAVQKPSKVVFGYLPDWQYVSSRDYLQYDLLTHIAAFDFTVAANGNVSKPSYWPWTDVINAAHANGVKVVLTAVNFNADEIHNLLTNQTAKQNFFANLKLLLNQYNLDGINIDFESLYTADRGSLLNGFMADLSSSIKQDFPEAEISFAGPAVNWGGWDFAGLATACDYIFIMGYSFAGSWSSTTGPNAPLTGGGYNITNTVTVQYASVTNKHPEKLILGVPYYGHRWKTAGSQAGASVIELKESTRFSQAEKEAQNYGRLWHSSSQTPWFRYQIGSQWYQVWFDDAHSLELKYDLSDSKNLLGVGMWALGYDGNRQELWNLLRQRYLPESQPQPVAPQAIFVRQGKLSNQLLISCQQVYGVQGYEIFVSTDGQNFQSLKTSASNEIVIDSLMENTLYFVKVRSFNSHGSSAFSSVLVASTSNSRPILLVDGFERNDQGHNTFDYLIQHGRAFFNNGQTIASATNDALIQSVCQPDSFAIIDWMCGDESQADFTLNASEKEIVKHFLENGGNLFISGSEIGYDLVELGSQDDRDFYTNYLKAEYVDDAPLGKRKTYYTLEGMSGTIFETADIFDFDNGGHGAYDVDWPDAILPADGASLGLKFKDVDQSNGGACIYYQGTFGSSHNESRLIYLTVPFETIVQESARNNLAGIILNYFSQPLALEQSKITMPTYFRFLGQYPNPFNQQTTFEFELSKAGQVELKIFNTVGQLVYQRNQFFSAGRQRLNWQAPEIFSSGLYFYSLQVKSKKSASNYRGKFILVK
ncbi:MAG: T9SS type A sorting domain-containing protein [Caldisericaceae bacterium]|nr:T9SS type A sorting domain-containing protein [Caldisericaceae bacterium]